MNMYTALNQVYAIVDPTNLDLVNPNAYRTHAARLSQ